MRKEHRMDMVSFFAKYTPEHNKVLLAKKREDISPDDIAPYAGCMYETYGEEYERVKQVLAENPKRVWTVLDGGGPYLCLSAGFHFVNRMGYIITEEEWENIEEEYWD